MKKSIRIFTQFLIALIILGFWLGNDGFAMKSDTVLQNYVVDEANVLTSEVKEHIIKVNQELSAKTGGEVVVVTVNSLEGQDIRSYANDLFAKNKIGDAEKLNGVLILLYVNQGKDEINNTGVGKVWIEVGYGSEGFLPDGKTGRIIDGYMLDDFKQKDFSEGIKKGFNAIIQEYENEYDISITGVEIQREKKRSGISIFRILIIIALIYLFIKGSHNGRGGRGNGSSIIAQLLIQSLLNGSSGSSSRGFSGFGGGSSGGGGAGRDF